MVRQLECGNMAEEGPLFEHAGNKATVVLGAREVQTTMQNPAQMAPE